MPGVVDQRPDRWSCSVVVGVLALTAATISRPPSRTSSHGPSSRLRDEPGGFADAGGLLTRRAPGRAQASMGASRNRISPMTAAAGLCASVLTMTSVVPMSLGEDGGNLLSRESARQAWLGSGLRPRRWSARLRWSRDRVARPVRSRVCRPGRIRAAERAALAWRQPCRPVVARRLRAHRPPGREAVTAEILSGPWHRGVNGGDGPSTNGATPRRDQPRPPCFACGRARRGRA